VATYGDQGYWAENGLPDGLSVVDAIKIHGGVPVEEKQLGAANTNGTAGAWIFTIKPVTTSYKLTPKP
jgi:hypothetical protein